MPTSKEATTTAESTVKTLDITTEMKSTIMTSDSTTGMKTTSASAPELETTSSVGED